MVDRLRPGDWVVWVPDEDEGFVCGLIPDHALAVRWRSTDAVEWYPLCSLAARERIALHEYQTADEVPPA